MKKKLKKKLNKEAFSLFHLNIRSLNNNVDKLKDLLGFLKGKFNVIVLIEAWANETVKNNYFKFQNMYYNTKLKLVRDEEGTVFLLEKE